MDDNNIKKILLEEDYVTEGQIKKAEEFALENKAPFIDYLFNKGIITKNILGQALAEHFGVPFIDLAKEKIDEEVLIMIPEMVARAKGAIAFSRNEQGVKVGLLNPGDLEFKNLLEKKFGQKVFPFFMAKSDHEEALARYKASLKVEFENILKGLQDKTKSQEERDETLVEMVDMLLNYGQQNKASDIHIEPYAKKLMVRFRIDGVMHDVLDIPKELSEYILSRIKIMSKMRTDEHRSAQDGKLRFVRENEEEMIDVRVSVVPVTQGENIVMRLLSAQSRQFDLVGLGFMDHDLEKVKRAIKNPHGMILVTGPTGSGKTTTLYAVLKIINKREVHISTIEDPVEYDIEGVSQIQVNPKTNLTFANGLRAIVRQDPDIIMVGEIRDEETAGIAVNSSLTGHLVLSTLHTNDAATALPRLLDMGIEPFLVSSTVNLVIAQRLVRKICEKCRLSHTPNDEEEEIIKRNLCLKEVCLKKGHKDIKKIRLYQGRGCQVCGNTGYSGRIGIFEVLEMTDNIKDLVVKRASSNEINKQAGLNNMTTMMEDGLEKVFSGLTTLEEVLRVTKE
ncbi:hypothetical protein COV49_01650 [Candidatus Falkowbacteria bacterium CG11_big_fil_rev_8_21_14_0_20_39_10]|uniref:Bacterial type II secretion system protein E domain-containing protein n=1 Tax=Candidatus Falkowbacteria bacterium CG11_big_fil_rev_8_21_14_0_20_39_10 TaxID=1974570 RepID=A0A2M6K9C6_9BACT|nr:MAG: hypothetical protein COV49_01650 [Candidatus Falkowbacteria bacterium CG11_big_fil_rev_8_21_14_0_20_39_10]